MNHKLPLLALLCVATATFTAPAPAAKAQVYKWVDASGVVHYADAPPPRGTPNVQTVRVTSSGDQVQAAAVDNAEPGSENSTTASNSPASTSTAVADAAKVMAKNCATARSNLDLLNTHYPVSTTGADGKPQPVDDSQRQAKIADAQAEIKLYCR
ncbi:MAG TPA: DUF4124 domain-containing protein [Rudaea sp.]|nr:DUF4124 domain-containing protein [Rudaea sp.]